MDNSTQLCWLNIFDFFFLLHSSAMLPILGIMYKFVLNISCNLSFFFFKNVFVCNKEDYFVSAFLVLWIDTMTWVQIMITDLFAKINIMMVQSYGQMWSIRFFTEWIILLFFYNCTNYIEE